MDSNTVYLFLALNAVFLCFGLAIWAHYLHKIVRERIATRIQQRPYPEDSAYEQNSMWVLGLREYLLGIPVDEELTASNLDAMANEIGRLKKVSQSVAKGAKA